MIKKITKMLIFIMITTIASLHAKGEIKIPEMEVMVTSPLEIVADSKYLGMLKLSRYIDTKVSNAHKRKSKYASILGVLTTDLFFYALDEEKVKFENTFSQLLSLSKRMSIHLKSNELPDHIKKDLREKKWKKLIQKLELFRRDIRKEYKEDYREDLATIVEASAWIESIYIVSKALHDEYDKKKSNILERKHVILYLKDKLKSTTNKSVEKETILLITTLDGILEILKQDNEGYYEKENVTKLMILIETNMKLILK